MQLPDQNPASAKLEKYRPILDSVWPVDRWSQSIVIAAVSAGPDSVSLLRLLHYLRDNKAKGQLVVAHVNQLTRGNESQADEQFVCELARELALPFHGLYARRFNHGKAADSGRFPSEQTLRNSRYSALIELAESLGARYIATGHNRDDQIETILFRLMRGTGLKGLSGIPPMRVIGGRITLVRPLLGLSRAELAQLLLDIRQPFRVDSSNSDSRYSRNFIRHQLLPLAKQRFPAVESSLARLAEQAHEVTQFLSEQSQPLTDSVVKKTDHCLVFDCQRFIKQPRILVRQFLVQCWQNSGWPQRGMTYRWWNAVVDLACSPTAHSRAQALELPDGIIARRLAGRLELTKAL